MIISLNWLKKYVNINIPIDELKEKIGRRLVEVESIEDLGAKYCGAIIARVVECIKHPDSDHLSICKIDDGGINKNVERDENGLIQVICGASNVRENLIVVWLPPEMIVPETFGSNNEFKLSSRTVRGEMSFGMIASLRELDLGDEHDGILEINPELAKPGDNFAKVFELDDYLIEVENKSLTHRPDCFGIIGFAREVAGILGQKFTEPNILQEIPNMIKSDDLTIEIIDPELCPRYSAAVIDLRKPEQEIYVQENKYLSVNNTYLSRSGVRPISHIVDVTNYLMLLTGQPLHAFDYDKFVKVGGSENPKIIVRAAKKGEKLELLNAKIIELDPQDIVITSNDIPVALAGAMGGKNTEIDADTQRIIVESATFNLYNLRGTGFRHGIFSESITRFTKGQPTAITLPVLNQAIQALSKNGEEVLDIDDVYPGKSELKVVEISADEVNSLLGSNFSYLEIERTLANVGFKISCECGSDDRCDCEKIKIQAPFWRTDIDIPEDIIEEVGRLNGYETLSLKLPTRELKMAESNKMIELKDKIREFLASLGANEVLTYTFVSSDLLEKVGQDPENSYELSNSISPELQYIRQQIVPNLLTIAYDNLRAGYDKFALFEINQIFQKDLGLTDENVPEQYDNLAFVLADKNSENDFYDTKNYLVKLGEKLNIEFGFRATEKLPRDESYFEPKRTALVFVGDVQIGIIGEIRASVLHELKLPKHVIAFEIGLNPLTTLIPSHSIYRPIPKFPGTVRDLCFQVTAKTSFAVVDDLLRENLNQLPKNFVWQIEPIDIYMPSDDLKNITLRVKIYDQEKTIDTKFISEVVEKVAKSAEQKLDAKII